MAELEGKVAVITGAGSGMGKATARVFARHGAKILAADVSGKEQNTAEEIGKTAVPFHCDVSREADVEAMMRACIEAFGQIDTVLNVAGIGVHGQLAELDMAGYDKVMDVDLRGVVHG